MKDMLNPLIRRQALRQMLGGISDSTLQRWENNAGFPRRIRLGENSVAWDLKSVQEWIAARAKIE